MVRREEKLTSWEWLMVAQREEGLRELRRSINSAQHSRLPASLWKRTEASSSQGRQVSIISEKSSAFFTFLMIQSMSSSTILRPEHRACSSSFLGGERLKQAEDSASASSAMLNPWASGCCSNSPSASPLFISRCTAMAARSCKKELLWDWADSSSRTTLRCCGHSRAYLSWRQSMVSSSHLKARCLPTSPSTASVTTLCRKLLLRTQ